MQTYVGEGLNTSYQRDGKFFMHIFKSNIKVFLNGTSKWGSGHRKIMYNLSRPE